MIRWCRIIPVLSLGLMGLTHSGCNKTKSADLQALQLTNLQISAFSLASTTDASLAKYSFSIDHNKTLIENTQPLPYGSTLDSIRLQITASASSQVSLSVKIGNEDYKAWKSTETYALGKDIREVLIKVTPSGEASASTSASHIYTVKLHQYSYDPETIKWEEASVTNLPIAGATDYIYGLPIYNGDGSNSTTSYIGASSSTASAWSSYTEGQLTATLNPLSSSGIATGRYIVHVEQNKQYIYAQDNQGNIYSLSGTNWTQITGLNASALLGVFPPRSSSATSTLALISTDGYFATYNEQEGYKVSTNKVPSDFPSAHSQQGVFRKSFPFYATHEGGKLHLVSVARVGAEAFRSTWYTTNGTNWVQIDDTIEFEKNITSAGFTLLDGLLYHVQSTDQGLEVYTSADNGATWKRNGNVALPADMTSFASAPISVWSRSTGDLYIYRGTSSALSSSTSLWIGKLQKSITQ